MYLSRNATGREFQRDGPATEQTPVSETHTCSLCGTRQDISGSQWSAADVWPSYRTADSCHLLSTPAALTTPRRPQSGCDGLSHFKRTQASPLYLP